MSAREPRRSVVDQAADWYARMLEPASEDEVAQFEAWLASDPSHPRAYVEIDAVNAAVSVAPLDQSHDQWNDPLDNERALKPQHRLAAAVWRPALAAALVAAFLVSAVIVFGGASSPAFAAITNDGPAVRGVKLSDSTKLWLDVDSAISVRMSADDREISVERGRVRLVPGADRRPLTVRAGTLEMKPVAGRFDITRDGDEVTLATLDRSLEVLEGDKASPTAILLERGQSLTFDRAGKRSSVPEVAWPVGRLQFSRAPLSRIVALANRQPGPDIIVGENVGRMRVSGVFDLRDTRRLARMLAAALDLQVEDGGKRLILHRHG